METATAAQALIELFFPHLPPKEKARIIWLAGNHDIGKATPEFQKKNLPDYKKSEGEYGHQTLSSILLRKNYGATNYEGKLIGAHHGVQQKDIAANLLRIQEEEIPYLEDYLSPKTTGGEDWTALQKKEAIKRDTKPLPDAWERNTFPSGEIAGFITLCDYIASSLPTQKENWEEDFTDEECERNVQVFLQQLKLTREVKFAEGIQNFETLTDRAPRQFQNLQWHGPGVYLLEAPTGAGKTEAALYLLFQALKSKDVTGGYFGLPTTLTSNRIFERIKNCLDGKITQGRIQLSHGKAWMQENPLHDFCEGISPEAHAWLCGNARSLSSPFGVGTIDQALMGTIHTNHWPLRALFLRNKLIICDEVHSYDRYTSALIKHAINNWTKEQGCSVLCLSATLSDPKKKQLFEGLPLTTAEFGFSFSTTKGKDTLPIEVGDAIAYPEIGLKKEFCRNLSPNDATYQRVLQEALKKAEAGAKVLWICNSVHNAQEAYKLIRHNPKAKLLHSRFTAEDRTIRENEVLQAFEKDDQNGMLLIGTQVLEQSLDLNADILFSEICPIELLFQRAGRLWRKYRENRPFKERTLHILLPTNNPSTSDVGSFGKTQSVYRDHFQLIRAWHWANEHENLNKTKVRNALHFHPEPEGHIEKAAAAKEEKAAQAAQTLAAKTSPTLLKEKDSQVERELQTACQAEELDLGATTRKTGLPVIEFILFRDSNLFWNGEKLENPITPTRKDRIQMERNSVRIPAHLPSTNPKEAGDQFQLGFNRYTWISETEYAYGLTYDPDLGMIENKRNL